MRCTHHVVHLLVTFCHLPLRKHCLNFKLCFKICLFSWTKFLISLFYHWEQREEQRDMEKKKKSIYEVGVEDLVKAGLHIEEAKALERVLKDSISGSDPREVWRRLVSRRVVKPSHPHALHQLIYYSVYADWDASTSGPPLYWFPSL